MAGVLTQKMKRFVVRALATGHGVVEVQRMVKQSFDVDITVPSLLKYNPTRITGARLSAPLRKLFFDTRARTNDELENTDLAHDVVRMRRLDEMHDEAMMRGDIKGAVVVITEARKTMDKYQEMPDTMPGAGKGDAE
ncbi:DUF2280 domain-containing protein [Paraburkholderia sp. DHOC27]|uniref:DUF2280 domain-containing protein n=1 Tax=Paraburkholderia sp. DHOC27 TaxID=2303330 RepID=UPI000E3D63EC|nr:DUF2280 domain-containing protein [Paraburkholderia sp. DHOC27]RFU48649.1 DUF2280 domain-containing protein [Paraburkholderia sp. DHOC27]